MEIKDQQSEISLEELIKQCGNPKILLVDDKQENIKVIGTFLKSLNWIQLYVALGGQEALKAAMEYYPDLIILDLNMTDMNGLETLKRLRILGALKFSTVIFLTADHSKENRLEGLSLGCADYIQKPFDQEELLIKINYHVKMRLYEKSLLKTLSDTKSLLNNLSQSIFFINKKGFIIPPVSKYSENIFGKDITGENIFNFLFYNLRDGTKELSDLNTVFSIIFGSDELQFFGLEDNLPKIVTLPDQKKKKVKTLKLSYAGFYDENNLLERLMCTVEDVTDSEEHIKKAEEDQESFNYISEIITVPDKEILAKNLEDSIYKLFGVLEDFVSPLSDTYTIGYFHKALENTIRDIQKKFLDLKSLRWKINTHLSELDKFEKFKKYEIQMNHQVEATTTICDMLESFLKYSSCVNRFVPVDLRFKLSFTEIILEKIKDMENIFKNLIEYVFLVRDTNEISKEKLKKVVLLAKHYPEFDRTIDLIHQRSRLLSFLLKGVGEEELSNTYQHLSSQVKKMPVRSRLTEFITKNNLIEPYKEVLNKTKDIKEELTERVKKRQNLIMDDKSYLLLLTDLMKRFIRENEEGPDQNLPPLPNIENLMIITFRSFVKIIELKFDDSLRKENDEEFIYRNTSNIEDIFRKILKKELIQKKALPLEKNNKKFIKFLKDYIPK